jgi:predicted acetyltransferase
VGEHGPGGDRGGRAGVPDRHRAVLRDELLTGSPSVRELAADELRPAHRLMGAALLQGPAGDGWWSRAAGLYEPGRAFGAFLEGRLAGTTASFATRTAVPGGASLPTAAVMRVGVRADATRRGALTALMGRQLAACAAAGDVLASLRASEGRIYGRFGFGVATRFRELRVRAGAGVRPSVPDRLRLLERTAVVAELAALHRRIGLGRPGGIGRSEAWWRVNRGAAVDGGAHVLAAVHTGPAGDDGFLLAEGTGPDELLVGDLHAADPAAVAALWRFVLAAAPARTVIGRRRPVDEPVELLLADPRDCATTGVDDETWLRILDVPAALAARRFAPADPVLLAVHDPLLPANTGTYRIADGTAVPVGGTAALSCDVAGLAMAYLGDRSPSELVATGWWRAEPGADLDAADAAFATAQRPWCGTYF